MPLSEDEQRILRQMERIYYERDPRSARRLAQTTLPRYLRRRLLLGLGGFVAGLAVLLAAFAWVWEIGIAGFLAMTLAAVVIVHNARRLGRHGMQLLGRDLRRVGLGHRRDRPGAS